MYLSWLVENGRGIGSEEEDYIPERMIEGIILRLTSGTKGEFSRIGSFNFYKDMLVWPSGGQIRDESYEPFLQVMFEQGTMTAEAVCAEIISSSEHSDHRYAINLI